MYRWEKETLWSNTTGQGKPRGYNPEYPYIAYTSSSLRPKKSMGELFCLCITTGRRWWAFKTVVARDKFIDTHQAVRVLSDFEKGQLHLLPAVPR